MCMGGKSKSAAPVTPAPAQPTSFQYVNADTSNAQQKQAAINSTTNAGNAPSSFGSELGSSSPTTGNTTGGA